MRKPKLFTMLQVLVALNEFAKEDETLFLHEMVCMYNLYIATLLDHDRLDEANAEITELGQIIFEELEAQGKTTADMQEFLKLDLVKHTIRESLRSVGYDPLLMERVFTFDELELAVNQATPMIKGASA